MRCVLVTFGEVLAHVPDQDVQTLNDFLTEFLYKCK
jgi:hypothetical protein